MRSGLPLTLGAVGALAVAAAFSRSGSRAFGHGGHWGRAGAGVLLTTGKKVLVLLRSDEVTEPGTWGLPGGAVDPGEVPLVAGLRELEEETGIEIDPYDATVVGSTVWHSPSSSFRYTTSVVRVPQSLAQRRVELNWENDAAKWWTAEDLVNWLDDLHPGLRAALPKLLDIAFDGALPAVVGPVEVPRRPADAPRAPDSPAFRRWFRDSQVVWADGSPRAVYHSGARTDFEVFDRTRRAQSCWGVKIDTLGSWFSTSAEPLYGPSVRGYWLSVQNPKVYAGRGAWRRMFRDAEAHARVPGSVWAQVWEAQQKKGGFPPYDRQALQRGAEQIRVLPEAVQLRLAKAYGVAPSARDPFTLWSAVAKDAVEAYRAALRRQGHDGVRITGDDFDGDWADAWIALDPTQIKSLDNAGTFDPEDPRVSANRRGGGSRNADLTSTAFRRWFGDSQVVDKTGRPLIVYHGSPDVRDLVQQGFKKSALRGHSYFATDRYDMANSYTALHRAFDYQRAEPAVIPLYLSIQNPMILDGHGKPWRGTEPAVEQARAAGHDGLIIRNSEDWYHGPPNRKARPTRANPYPNAGTVYIWFSPTQAKSAATGPLLSRTDRAPIAGSGPNVGTWDPNDARLSYNRSAR